jgi:2-acylglycerol O-acyltransferase 2
VWALLMPLSISLSIFLLFQPWAWMAIVPYFTYCVLDRTSSRGGRKLDWFRRLAIWRYFADYFPIRLTKTVNLDPKKNYVFGYHPHGS